MCIGCYEEQGSPAPTLAARELGERLKAVNEFGGCHIAVSDWNLDDECIDFCIAQPDTTQDERAVMVALKALTEDQRYAAMAVADGYS